MESFQRSEFTFDVHDEGPADAPAVILLHGWPGGASTWNEVVPALHRSGLRTLAPEQRGYASKARPRGRRAYAISELVEDVLALLDAANLPQAHVVGHDWGGAVAWTLAANHSERVTSLTVLSTPHPRAMARSLASSDQALRSAYVAAFQVPFLPERLMLAGGGAPLRLALRRSGLSAGVADAYVTRQREPGALTASLAWYRALPLSTDVPGDVTVPTRYVWSSGDTALGRRAAELTGDHVSGKYLFQVAEGASHWLPEEHPDLVARAIADHIDGL